MDQIARKIDDYSLWLALGGSILLHLTVILVMQWQHNAPQSVVIEKPKVTRIRILSNPNGDPRTSIKTAEIKAQPVAKPKPTIKEKAKRKLKAKTKVKNKPKLAQRNLKKPQKIEAETPPSPSKAAPQSFGDNKSIGMTGTGVSNTRGPSDPNATTDWLPIEQIKPNMPREAALKGIEGFITFNFDINEEGRVENVRVTEAENRSVFENEARRAVRKFRYRPRRINGRPVRVVGHSFTVIFKLTH